METEVNSEYKKLISNITEVLLNSSLKVDQVNKLNEVKHALVCLGSTPKLEGSVKMFYDITVDMAKTYAAKNHDYGNSFDQSLDEFGLVASLVRVGDKINRLKTLTRKAAQVKDESIKDTLLDMANYCIMTYMWLTKHEE